MKFAIKSIETINGMRNESEKLKNAICVIQEEHEKILSVLNKSGIIEVCNAEHEKHLIIGEIIQRSGEIIKILDAIINKYGDAYEEILLNDRIEDYIKNRRM